MAFYMVLVYVFLSYATPFLLFNRNIAMANVEVDRVCKKAPNYNYCIETFNTDPRSRQADLKNLGKISIEITMSRIQDVIDKEIPEVRKNIGDAVGQHRLDFCKANYKDAKGKFAEALKSSDKGDYKDVVKWVQEGKHFVIECENKYWSTRPIAEPPIAPTNQKTLNLAALILSINDMLKNA